MPPLLGSEEAGLGSVATAAGQSSGGGTGSVNSVTAGNTSIVIGGTPTNPTVRANLSSATPQVVGPASAGVLLTEARGDHSHSTLLVANAAALAAVDASTMNAGVYAYVTTLRCWFKLEGPTTQAAAALVRIVASGKASHLWCRETLSPTWWNQTAWFINSSTGNDENDGAVATPLATFAEYRRRHWLRWLPGTETGGVSVTIVGDLGVNDYVSACWTQGLRGGNQILTVTGTPTVVATGTIVAGGFNAQNRATGQRNTINAGFAWAAHVGRFVRLQATPTTVAAVMEDLGGNVAALGDQSANGTLATGFTVGQVVEVVTSSIVPGVHVTTGAPDIVNLVDCDVGVVGGFQLRHTSNGNIQCLRSRFGGTLGQINAGGFRPNTAIFNSSTVLSCGAAWFGSITTTVNQPAGGIVLASPFDRNHIADHCTQGPAFTVGENCYANISGTGSGLMGVFGLAAAGIAVQVNIGGHFSCSNMWGSGNNAASIPILVATGGSWSKVQNGASNFGGLVSSGLGLSLQDGTGAAINIPVAQLPSAIGNGQQPAIAAVFASVCGDAAIPITSYMDGSGANGVGNVATQYRYPTSERCFVRLRLGAPVGTGANPPTATLMKNGAATLMTVTLPAGAAAGANVVVSVPILYNPADTFDVRLTQPIAAEGPAPYVVTLEAVS